MNDGSIVEIGTHNELILADGEYKKMYNAQQKWYVEEVRCVLRFLVYEFMKGYNFNDFMKMVDKMPWIVKMTFNEDNCEKIEYIDCIK